MRLDDQAVESEVHGLLRERGHQLAFAADVARVAEDRQLRQPAVQLDGDRPHRVIAVEALVDGGEAAVNDAQPADSGIVDAFHGADPELQVGTYGVLDQHRDVVTPQGVGDLLHGEGVGRGACPDPEQVDAACERRRHMVARGDLRRRVHARFAFHAGQPRQPLDADPLETARFGPRFPDAGPEDPDPLGRQLAGGLQKLFFGLGAARAGDGEGAPSVEARQGDGLQIVHVVCVFFVRCFGLRGAFQSAGAGHSAYSPRMRKSLVSGRAASMA